MAKNLTLNTQGEVIQEMFFKLFQSTRINFIFGSGASMPAISIAGNLEADVQEAYTSGKNVDATRKLYDFLSQINACTSLLINKNPDEKKEIVQSSYSELIKNIERILNERRTNILPKQANIFTTNYDLFIEDSCENFNSILLNDGFNRRSSLTGDFKFSTNVYFNSIFNNGNLYNYKVELPSINLFKLHGSMSWKIKDNDIVFSVTEKDILKSPSSEEMEKYNNAHALILPRKQKFQETVLQHVYYDMLRLYANELDKENTTLIAFGFSFLDEHIFEITQRALKNPTLKIIVFAFNNDAKNSFISKFNSFHNVDIISTGDENFLDFKRFNEIFNCVLPERSKNASE